VAVFFGGPGHVQIAEGRVISKMLRRCGRRGVSVRKYKQSRGKGVDFFIGRDGMDWEEPKPPHSVLFPCMQSTKKGERMQL
jgi:hypothetical protein